MSKSKPLYFYKSLMDAWILASVNETPAGKIESLQLFVTFKELNDYVCEVYGHEAMENLEMK